ncbi:MAG: cytochrome ubiquinol oxidase subunit I [Planctomycetes bacterium]|nr:cytochrome ubiquinol oxidase subunit I [Planctomycetota bacterium]
MDVLLLSRLQFAFTVMFHYLFPPLTIGMGAVIAYLLFRYWRSGDPVFGSAARFWTRVFALNFAIGVASGIVMEFEFGTNWANYSRFVGDVFGSALAAEGIFAFFLESGFLAILVFGWERVRRGTLFFAGLMVWLGSCFSSVWIVVANSWQHTPAGSHFVQRTEFDPTTGLHVPVWLADGAPAFRAEIVDFWAMVFNPSSVHRLTHVLLGCFIMGTFFVLSISAWYLLRGRHLQFARRSFRGALVLATVSSVAIALSGHRQAQSVYATQPAKLAAFEGHYRTERGDLSLFGIPNDETAELESAIQIPGLLSFLVHDDFSGKEVIGLDRVRPEDRPPTLLPFIAWRVMVGTGTFFIALTLAACFLWWRGRLFETRWILWLFVFAVLPAVAANQAGWVATEVGRQPWIVHPTIVKDDTGTFLLDADGYLQYETSATLADGTVVHDVPGLRTRDGLSPSVGAAEVVTSIALFALIYGLLGAVWVFVLNEKIQHGPDPVGDVDDDAGDLRDALGHRDVVTSPTERRGS